jgi:hypothetical protein
MADSRHQKNKSFAESVQSSSSASKSIATKAQVLENTAKTSFFVSASQTISFVRLASCLMISTCPNSFLTHKLSQDVKRFGGSVNGKGHENKDTGYSSSSSSSNGMSKLSSLNCHNCTVLCNELKTTGDGSFNLCGSCFLHWR